MVGQGTGQQYIRNSLRCEQVVFHRTDGHRNEVECSANSEMDIARRAEGANAGRPVWLRWSVNLTLNGVLSRGRRVSWERSACAKVSKTRCGGQSKGGPKRAIQTERGEETGATICANADCVETRRSQSKSECNASESILALLPLYPPGEREQRDNHTQPLPVQPSS